ncbi:FHA domain-containing protein [Halorarum salinum]|uniref:DUF8009 domain-containing protein n=1 Tax=Halorarum salinum TaxID=2743089 RepID=A0A7D5LB83_9EURY|nr:hypothetical protein [Halobaculum salinum]QLG62592.1 hypothetical protein HUG12_13000 [Halobaculum salinum]
MTGDDVRAVESLAVTTDDVVAAVEARDRGRRRAVLRVTPPFSARMRARLHVEGGEGEYGSPSPIHLQPRVFVREGVPRYPGRGPERWRSTVRESLRTEVELDAPDGVSAVRVSYLG